MYCKSSSGEPPWSAFSLRERELHVKTYKLLVPTVSTAVALSLFVQPSAASPRPPEIPTIPGATHIIVPGTDDRQGTDQLPRMDGWFEEGADVLLVDYSATLGPFIGGLLAPSYDESSTEGILNTLTVVRNTDGPVIIYGFSQGSKVAGNVAALISQLGLKEGEVEVVLMADPRFPNTGTEPQLRKNHPVFSWVLENFLGVTPEESRDPADTGHIPVTSVAIIGDPAASLETWYLNPLGFLLNTPTGFMMIHSDQSDEANYGKLDDLDVLKTWTDGNTTYVVYDAPHPVALFLRHYGIPVDERGERFWELVAPRTVPGQDPAKAPSLAKIVNWIDTELKGGPTESQSEPTPPPATTPQAAESDSIVVEAAPTATETDSEPGSSLVAPEENVETEIESAPAVESISDAVNIPEVITEEDAPAQPDTDTSTTQDETTETFVDESAEIDTNTDAFEPQSTSDIASTDDSQSSDTESDISSSDSTE